jgi:hypothetical protein
MARVLNRLLALKRVYKRKVDVGAHSHFINVSLDYGLQQSDWLELLVFVKKNGNLVVIVFRLDHVFLVSEHIERNTGKRFPK